MATKKKQIPFKEWAEQNGYTITTRGHVHIRVAEAYIRAMSNNSRTKVAS